MQTTAFQIELTPEESVIVGEMTFDQTAFQRDRERFIQNSELAYKLSNSLIQRSGIPPHRLRYFTDPEYFEGGRGKSRQQVYERNGTSGDDILRHPNFLKHLRYFIFGTELPASITSPFASAVKECGMVTSGDIAPLGAIARQLARAHGLERTMAADEFYKLCLDLGLSTMNAGSIRSSVLQLRNAR